MLELDQKPVIGSVEDYFPITLKVVNKTDLEPLWDESIRNYHYLGFRKMIGPSIKYLAWAADNPVAALSYNRASLRVGVRDAYIGWSEEGRHQLLENIICNHRYLIFPWVNVRNLASCVLAESLRSVRIDWKNAYGIEPQLVETFIDSIRYRGTCYLAANFTYLGETKGYGKIGKIFEYHGKKKKVFLYELNRDFINSIAPHLQRTVQPIKSEKPGQMASLMTIIQIPDWGEDFLSKIGVTAENLQDIPEMLTVFLQTFIMCFRHKAQPLHFATYVKGLMSDLERKSIERIALQYGDSDAAVRNLQLFMKESPWNHNLMSQKHHEMLSKLISDDDGMLIIDGCDFIKKGDDSAGVARQYCGPAGKTENCQASVMASYCSNKGVGLLASQLYLPEQWLSDDYAEKREACDIPDNIKFKTKNEIASEMINSICSRGLFNVKWILADGAFGHDRKFVDSIPKGINYFLDVHADDQFYLKMPKVSTPKWSGIGRKPFHKHANKKPLEVRKIVNDDKSPWRKVYYIVGSKGPVIGYEKVFRVLDIRNGLPNKLIWLYVRKLSDGSIKYSISNAPDDIPVDELRKLAVKRWPIEQCFEECKTCLGMDHYEFRSWVSWHRHMLIVFICHLFLQLLRKKFSINKSDLSKPIQEIYKIDHDDDSQSDISVLTTNMVRQLFIASDETTQSNIKTIFRKFTFIVKSYAKSFLSFCRNCAGKVFNIFIPGKHSPKKDFKIMRLLSQRCRKLNM
jgi:SRSO17 transposase